MHQTMPHSEMKCTRLRQGSPERSHRRKAQDTRSTNVPNARCRYRYGAGLYPYPADDASIEGSARVLYLATRRSLAQANSLDFASIDAPVNPAFERRPNLRATARAVSFDSIQHPASYSMQLRWHWNRLGIWDTLSRAWI